MPERPQPPQEPQQDDLFAMLQADPRYHQLLGEPPAPQPEKPQLTTLQRYEGEVVYGGGLRLDLTLPEMEDVEKAVPYPPNAIPRLGDRVEIQAQDGQRVRGKLVVYLPHGGSPIFAISTYGGELLGITDLAKGVREHYVRELFFKGLGAKIAPPPEEIALTPYELETIRLTPPTEAEIEKASPSEHLEFFTRAIRQVWSGLSRTQQLESISLILLKIDILPKIEEAVGLGPNEGLLTAIREAEQLHILLSTDTVFSHVKYHKEDVALLEKLFSQGSQNLHDSFRKLCEAARTTFGYPQQFENAMRNFDLAVAKEADIPIENLEQLNLLERDVKSIGDDLEKIGENFRETTLAQFATAYRNFARAVHPALQAKKPLIERRNQLLASLAQKAEIDVPADWYGSAVDSLLQPVRPESDVADELPRFDLSLPSETGSSRAAAAAAATASVRTEESSPAPAATPDAPPRLSLSPEPPPVAAAKPPDHSPVIRPIESGGFREVAVGEILLPSLEIGRMRIVRLLTDRGSVGRVFEVTGVSGPHRDEMFVMKALKKDWWRDPNVRERMVREYAILQKLKEKGAAVPQPYYYQETPPAIFMEKAKGKTLQHHLYEYETHHRGKIHAIPQALGLELAIPVLQTLQAAHEIGISSRDNVNMSEIFWDGDSIHYRAGQPIATGSVTIVDWNVVDDLRSKPNATPQQDLMKFCNEWYKLLTGEPYASLDPKLRMYDSWEKLSPEVQELLLRGRDETRPDRWQSADEVIAEIQRILKDQEDTIIIEPADAGLAGNDNVSEHPTAAPLVPQEKPAGGLNLVVSNVPEFPKALSIQRTLQGLDGVREAKATGYEKGVLAITLDYDPSKAQSINEALAALREERQREGIVIEVSREEQQAQPSDQTPST